MFAIAVAMAICQQIDEDARIKREKKSDEDFEEMVKDLPVEMRIEMRAERKQEKKEKKQAEDTERRHRDLCNSIEQAGKNAKTTIYHF